MRAYTGDRRIFRTTAQRRGTYLSPPGQPSVRFYCLPHDQAGLKLLKKEPMGPAKQEGYFSRGIRKCFFKEKNGAARAVEMMLARLKGEPFEAEYEMPVFKKIPPAKPVKNLKNAVIAICSGGVVPVGNPDHIRVSSADSFGAYDISAIDDMTPANFESIHGGYDRAMAAIDPDCIVPLDELRALENAEAAPESEAAGRHMLQRASA